MLSLRATGTPAKGPAVPPRARLSSTARAWARADSSSTVRKAFIPPSRARMRSRKARQTSTADRARARTWSRSCRAVWAVRSAATLLDDLPDLEVRVLALRRVGQDGLHVGEGPR